MSWSDLVLLNSLWLGFHGQSGFPPGPARTRYWWLMAIAPVAAFGMQSTSGTYPLALIGAGILLLGLAVGMSLGCAWAKEEPYWAKPLDTTATAMALLFSGRWMAFGSGFLAGWLLAVGVGPSWTAVGQRLWQPLQPAILGMIAIADLRAGWLGTVPHPHIAWIWMAPFLILSEVGIWRARATPGWQPR